MKQRNPSVTNKIKERIQESLRQIVIKRDGGCVLRYTKEAGPCSGFMENGDPILQADHLVTRSNSATFTDTRLVVCLCQGHHGQFKQQNKAKYDYLIKKLLPSAWATLWEEALKNQHVPTRKFTMDWQQDLDALNDELAAFKPPYIPERPASPVEI